MRDTFRKFFLPLPLVLRGRVRVGVVVGQLAFHPHPSPPGVPGEGNTLHNVSRQLGGRSSGVQINVAIERRADRFQVRPQFPQRHAGRNGQTHFREKQRRAVERRRLLPRR